MIRQFGLRDLFLAGKLWKKGVLLDPERALIHSYSPLRAVLTSYLSLLHEGDVHTYIFDAVKEGQASGFVQMQQRPDEPVAKVIYLAPSLPETDEAPFIWHRLLTHLCVKTGERGVQRLLVSLPEDGLEVEIFQQVGFSVYAHEEILRLEHASSRQQPTDIKLCQQRSADNWDLQRLHYAATPPLVQLAEVNAGHRLGRLDGKGYVLEDEGKIAGHLRIREGRRGYWLRMLLHPQAHHLVTELVEQALLLLSTFPHRPVYCGLRSYQGWLREPLREKGFRPLARRSLMVKHTTVHAPKPAVNMVPAMERKAEALTTVRFDRK